MSKRSQLELVLGERPLLDLTARQVEELVVALAALIRAAAARSAHD
jgi:hypothetical protein